MVGAAGGEVGAGEEGFEGEVGELVAAFGVDGLAGFELDALSG